MIECSQSGDDTARPPVVWVTGAAGFSGRAFIDFLQSMEDPPRVIGFGRAARADEPYCYRSLDLADRSALIGALQEDPPDLVLHLAGVMPPDPLVEQWRVNVGATAELLWALERYAPGETRVVVVGSCAEYRATDALLQEESPVGGETVYGRTKWAQTQVALAKGFERVEVMLVRPFNLLGPGLPERWVAGALARQFAQRAPRRVAVGNLSPVRDFVDVRDAVRAYWLALTQGAAGRIYNVCSGRPVSIAELVEAFRDAAEGTTEMEVEPSRERRGDVHRVVGDPTRSADELGWSAEVPLVESVRSMLNWEIRLATEGL